MAVLNHNYPVLKAMRVVETDGTPIEGATIRVFEAIRFYADDVQTWVAETTTDINGNWRDPIVVPDAEDWVVQVQKIDTLGPEHIDVTT